MIRLTDEQRRAALRSAEEADRVRMVEFLSQHRFFRDDPRELLTRSVDMAFEQRRRLDVTTSNGLAWLVILNHLAVKHPRLADIPARIERARGWTWDQLARTLQRRGGV